MPDHLLGRAWVEAEADSSRFFSPLLLSLIAWGPDRSPALIGTAFIQNMEGARATAFTAAHNISAIIDAQSPKNRTHSTALPEFTPEKIISLNERSVRAIYNNGSNVYICKIESIFWDKSLDIAVINVQAKSKGDFPIFTSALQLKQEDLMMGDSIALVGIADMEVIDFKIEGELERIHIRQRISVRTGTVTALYPDGHILTRSPAVETSIPVMGGMSGGAVFRLPEPGEPMFACGLISSDPEGGVKTDFGVSGSSIASLLRFNRIINSDGIEMLELNFSNARLSLTD